MKYIAFLRGINVGGNKKVPMGDLKKMFEASGFTDVKTLLNSGNVVFSSDETEISAIKNSIEQSLIKKFGFAIPVIVRSQEKIKQLVEDSPFKHIEVTKDVRLYVTFLAETPKTSLKIPYESEDKALRILRVSNSEVCSLVVLSAIKGTLDLMGFIEKEFGKNVTTRNWNTVVKLVEL
jgi:uncharacterized protein (DUF1697 family)